MAHFLKKAWATMYHYPIARVFAILHTSIDTTIGRVPMANHFTYLSLFSCYFSLLR